MRLIDADALIDEAIERYCENCDKRKGIKNGKWKIVYQIGGAPCRACEVDDMKCEIEDAPTIEPERETGEWCVTPDGMLVCSNCFENPTNRIIVNGSMIYDMTPIKKRMRFCPNCGADTRGTDNADS